MLRTVHLVVINKIYLLIYLLTHLPIRTGTSLLKSPRILPKSAFIGLRSQMLEWRIRSVRLY